MARELHVEIDDSLCVGTESCIYTAPRTFAVEGGKTIVIVPPGDDESAIVDAALQCPMQAITVRDAETGVEIRP